MIEFKRFVTEQLEKFTKLKHLEHAEDLPIDAGEHGYHHAVEALHNVNEKLKGHHNTTKITTKFDGCLHENTILLTKNGEKTIKEITEKWYFGKEEYVWAYNEETKENQWTLITDKFVLKNGNKKWVSINFDDKFIILTEDHRVFTTNRGWVEAKNLTVEDDIQEY